MKTLVCAAGGLTSIINDKHFAVCQEWYEASANNDRPYLIAWIQDFKKKEDSTGTL